mmetsp:Transcript_12862/g.31011  ORF Transcript_12862/g.31011 Transcript_12862/m.31011 type:complete len:273 (+) Transcript_12862:201-1019(+)|eukprot:CAMPEP_0197575306 /NCGR_PEP_ID=MMETSP1326-20131121/748_1 /TAXON_ID=1155430 /ORGANISM="Genus nov. species nov., Strain RCC2288" /LENGTH=272 /DNA_ID=CAMNT_0043138049 /DNA_START=183 /DNA_END=1001 /DNA_ORIENTATION=-
MSTLASCASFAPVVVASNRRRVGNHNRAAAAAATTTTTTAAAPALLPLHNRRRLVRASASEGTTPEDGTIDLILPTEDARKTLQFDKIMVPVFGPVIFVTGVAIGSAAEAAGVKPGQRLIALTDPISAPKLWFLDGSERLAFVLDAIRSGTKRPEITIIIDSEVTVTKEIVDKARPPEVKWTETPRAAMGGGDKAKVTAADLAPPGSMPPQQQPKKRDREDLYSENWEGDKFVGGGFWNELTVGIAIFLAVPTVITVVATTTNGVLWNTTGF